MPIFLLLVLLLPVIELTVMYQVGSHIGLLNTIGLTVLTALIGISLVCSQGLAVMQRAQANMAAGQGTAPEMIEGAMLAFSGVCLLIPGFLTDLVGASLLVPPLRMHAAKYILSHKVMRFNTQFASKGSDTSSHNTFDGEFERKDDHDRLN